MVFPNQPDTRRSGPDSMVLEFRLPREQLPVTARLSSGEPTRPKRTFSRVVITSDFLRVFRGQSQPRQCFQHGGILWLADWLAPVISDVTGLESEVISWGPGYDRFNIPEFQKSQGYDYDFHSWLRKYSTNCVTKQVAERFRAHCEDALVIGFELSPYQQALYSAADVPFISLSVHPARFAPDLLMRAETNHEHIAEVLRYYSLSERALRRFAGIIRAQRRRSKLPQLISGSILFCGQVEEDASLIDGAKMVGGKDFFDEIAGLADCSNHLYYKRHPYAEKDEELVDFAESLENSSLIDHEIYSLLSSDAIAAVAAISSGTLYEADLFGKKTIRLLDNHFNYSKLEEMFTLDGRVLDAPFWVDLLAPFFKVRQCDPGLVSHIPNPIQSALVTNWRKQPGRYVLNEFAPLALGVAHAFRADSTGKAALGSGWGVPESWGVWADGSHARLAFRVGEPVSQSLVVTLRLRGFASETRPTHVEWRCRGQRLGTTTLDNMSDQIVHLTIPQALFGTSRTVELEAISRGGGTTKELGGGADLRIRYFGLRDLKIMPGDGRWPCGFVPFDLDLTSAARELLCKSGWELLDSGCPAVGIQPADLKLRFRKRPSTDVYLELRNYEILGTPHDQGVLALRVQDEDVSTACICRSTQGPCLRLRIPRYAIGSDGILDAQLSYAAVSPVGEDMEDEQAKLRIPYLRIGSTPRLDAWPTFDASWVVEPHVEQAAAVQVGRRYTVGEDDVLEQAWGKGWTTGDATSKWSNGRHAVLNLKIDGDLKTPINLSLRRAQFHAPPNCEPVRLTVWAKQRELAAFEHQGFDEIDELRVPLPTEVIAADGCVSLSFRLENLRSPRQLGHSGDARRVGLLVRELEVVPTMAESERPSMSHDPRSSGVRDRRISASCPSAEGVMVIGQNRVTTGMGVASRSAAAALARGLGASRVSLFNFNHSQHLEMERQFESEFPCHQPRRFNLFFLPPPVITQYVRECGLAHLKQAYSICFGAWELETLPSHLADDSYFDEYWGMSQFIADAARKKMEKPVRTMPLPVDLAPPRRRYSRAELGLAEDRFLFLFSFCADSTIARKNPLAVVRAFQAAFPNGNTKVGLVLKTKIRQANDHVREEYSRLKETIREDPRISILEGLLDADRNKSLFLQADAYVSLHRSEGYGLTLAEAMGMGIPTIGTAYSGNLDFMTELNSCLVDYSLIDMGPDEYHRQTQRWADADVDQAAYYMRKLCADDVFRSRIARQGLYDIRSTLSLDAVSRRYLERLKEIETTR